MALHVSSLGLRSTPKSPKSTLDLHWRNTVRVDPYAHPQHFKALKHLHTYVMIVRCSLKGFGGLTNRQSNKNTHQKCADLRRYISLRVDPHAHPQHIKVLKHLHTYDMDVGCILRGFGGPINQKPILASKMPTARGILA